MNKLVDYVQKYKQENPTGWRKWLFGSIAVLAILVLVIGFSIQTALRARELAKLKHDLDVAQNDLVSTQATAKIETHQERKEQAVLAAELAEERAAALKEQIVVLESVHKQNEDIINSIRSWEDVDAKVR